MTGLRNRTGERGGTAPPTESERLSYEHVRGQVAAELDRVAAHVRVTATRLVVDLHAQIGAALDRGLTYGEVARVFERHGVAASADAVRVAFDRDRRRREAGEPGREPRRQTAEPAVPSAEHPAAEPRAATTTSDPPRPEPIERSPSASPDVAVGRHLD